jgi:hypothetical protein
MSKKTSKPKKHQCQCESLNRRLGPPDSDFENFHKDTERWMQQRPSKEDDALMLKLFGIRKAQ